MERLLVIEPIGGIAGDMFLAAALDLGVDRSALVAALSTLDVKGWRLAVSRKNECGISGTHVDVVLEGEQPHSRDLNEIVGIVERSGLGPRARATARAMFERIGRAEAKVHGVAIEEVHFHEIGAVDSIVDVCGAAVAMELLGWPRLVSSPPELGQGLTASAHGPMPVPPPAVLELLAGKPVLPGGPRGEAVTPTGAAILAELAEVRPLPAFVPARVGYGVGTVSWSDRPNVLRMIIAEEAAVAPGASAPVEMGAKEVWLLEANLDDCPGELVARALEAALEAGALDAWAAPITMKKGRPGILVAALASDDRRAPVTRKLFEETTTLGVRRRRVEREVLAREVRAVKTPYGEVRVKTALLEGREVGAHPEFEDCAARARERGVSVKEVMAAALAAHRTGRA